METKKVTLNNGTVLEVGKTFINNVALAYWFEVLYIGNDKYFWINKEGREGCTSIKKDEDVIPYTPPTPKKEWKTFLIEVEEYNANSVWSPARRAIVQMYSIEYAKRLYPKAKITEVKINIEEVK